MQALVCVKKEMADFVGDGESLALAGVRGVHADDGASIFVSMNNARDFPREWLQNDLGIEQCGELFNGYGRFSYASSF
jgi:hypothetical protein